MVTSTPAAGTDARITLARHAMLRVALWPVDTLDALQETALAAQSGTAGFAACHDAALERQRDTLAALTTTPAFERALALANPVVAQRWRAGGGRARTRKARDRRLEASIVRFLCRAAGRATPNGAWAGVAPVVEAPGSADAPAVDVVEAPSRWWVAPSLAPFATAARWIGASAGYLREAAFELEPTLHRRDDRWWMWGPRGWRALPEHRFLHSLVAWFEAHAEHGHHVRLATFVASIADPGADEAVWAALAALAASEALKPAVLLRSSPGTPSTVLRTAAEALPPQDRASWMSAVTGLEALGTEIAAGFEQLDGAGLTAALGRGSAHLRRLWAQLGVPGEPAWPPVRIDAGAPFRATWSAPTRTVIARGIEELLEVWAADGTPEWYRSTSTAPVQAGPMLDVLWSTETRLRARGVSVVPDSLDSHPTRGGVAAALFGDRRSFPVEDAWAAAAADGRVRPDDLLGPWSTPPGSVPWCGAHLLTRSDGLLRFEAGRPQPGAFFGRHWQLDVGTAVSAEIGAVFAERGVVVADVVGQRTANPDAALRHVVGAYLDLADRRVVHGLAVGDGLCGVPLLSAGPGSRAVLGLTGSAAAPIVGDPLTLLMTRLGGAHGWEFLSFGPPLLEADLAGDRVTPRLGSAAGHVIGPRRLVAAPSWVETVRVAAPAERFRMWLALLAQAGFGSYVRARWGLAQPLLMPVTSPLVVEALLGSIPSAPPPLVVEEAPRSDLVRDAAGRSYVAELAVAWWRT